MSVLPSAPSFQIFPLDIGDVLTITNDAVSTGRAGLVGDLPGDGDQPSTWTAMAASAVLTFGPFISVKRVRVDCLTGGGVSTAIVRDGVDQFTAIGDFSGIRELIGAGAPTDGTTGANVAGKGSRYTDVTNAKLYINGGTTASPTWKIVTSA